MKKDEKCKDHLRCKHFLRTIYAVKRNPAGLLYYTFVLVPSCTDLFSSTLMKNIGPTQSKSNKVLIVQYFNLLFLQV